MSEKRKDQEIKLSYEEAILRLEEITNLLEQGDCSLEESLQLFKEGMELAKFCETKLKEMEEEIKKFQPDSEGKAEEVDIKSFDE